MPYGCDSAFPESTGQNLSQTSVAVLGGNTVDSVASDDLSIYVTAKQNGMLFPNAIYNTGKWAISATEAMLTNTSGEALSAKFTVSGEFLGSSTSNAAVVQMRLRSTGGVGTGTTKRYSAGITLGATVAVGFTTVGAFTLQPGESVWLECSKNVTGTLILGSCLILAELIY